jgi:hypothetical protein
MSDVLLLKSGQQWFSKEDFSVKYTFVLKQLSNE